jgi:Flp pilus assembly protein TadD
MATLLETRERNVIPRWRDFRTTAHLGELDSHKRDVARVDRADLSQLIAAWEANPAIPFAGDLISAALVNGVPEVAREASEFVLATGDEASMSLRSLAQHLLTGRDYPVVPRIRDPKFLSVEGSRRPSPAIAHARAELGTRPMNAILWMDLAYLYAIRGIPRSAERAIRVAVQLAPSNRFVLRSAARFFVHQNRPGEAHALIRRAPGTRHDPWLLAAEIALSMAADNSSFFAKDGISMLSAGRFSAHHLSELSSAIGTLEALNGSTRRAKKHIQVSLIKPTDNSLAQATWLAQDVGGMSLEIPSQDYEIEKSFEANMYRSFIGKEWGQALRAAIRWTNDQPFSSRAARSAAYLANTIFLDHELGEKISKFGQIANPKDPGFFIGLAYSYARRNMLKEAEAELAKVTATDDEDWLPVGLDANYGLISYRRGDSVTGRLLYAEAASKADQLKDKRIKVTALTNWVLEEAKYSKELAYKILEEAREAAKKANGPEVPFMLARALDALKELDRKNDAAPIVSEGGPPIL